MKKKTILSIVICLIMMLGITMLAACNPDNGNGDKTWPTISYLSDTEKYTGSGTITKINEWDNDDVTVDINGATEASVTEYINKLIAAGWAHVEGSPAVGADKTNYAFTKIGNEAQIAVIYFKSEQSKSDGSKYNLEIQVDKDGGYTSGGEQGIKLATPNVGISVSGVASWSAINGASGYKYKLNNGAEQATNTLTVQLTAGQSISVKAVGDGSLHTDSDWSSAKTYTSGGGDAITAADFEYALGTNFHISSKWDVKYFDPDYTYQEYVTIALINGVYYIEQYDYNYEQSGARDNFKQMFFAPKTGGGYTKYVRYDESEQFESSDANESDFNAAFNIGALSNTPIGRAKLWYGNGAANFSAGAISTHTTGATVKKYTYSAGNTTMYEFFVDTVSKACVKFIDHINDGTMDCSKFNISDNTFGQNGLPSFPGIAASPTQLTLPNVTINNSGEASWEAVANAAGYKYKINNGAEQTAPSNRTVTLTNGQSIVVKALGNDTSFTDSDWSVSKTYTQQTVTENWPNSTKLGEYGFSGLTKPSGATLTAVAEGTADGQQYLAIVMTGGAEGMFNSLTTSLYNDGANYGYNANHDGVEQKAIIGALRNSTESLKSFAGFKPTGATNMYYLASVEYFVTATVDAKGSPIAAGTINIVLTQADFSAGVNPDPGNDPAYGDYIQLPNKFTIVYNTGTIGETKTLTKDGDKLHWKVVSEYEDRERLAVKQADGSYKIYEKDNKNGNGEWDTSYVPEYSNINYALEALDSNFMTDAQNRINAVTPSGTGNGTVAGMTCNINHYVSSPYTYSYYTYCGLVFKAVEQNNNEATITSFEVTSYSSTADLSGASYQL